MRRVNVQFDREANGELSLVREGGHTLPRILHVADHTGEAIEVCLARALAEHPNITLLTGHTAVDLLTPSHHALNRLCVYEPRSCVGAYLYSQEDRQIKRVLANKTVLATGGLGQIFLRTSNPVGSRGDGVAMAWNAGARIINMEFIQFHPTTFHKEGAPNFLISEAVRGAGAKLVERDGRAVHAALRAGVEGPGAARYRRAQHPPRDALQGPHARVPRSALVHPAR